MGIRFQLNLGSVVGLYGPEVKHKAEKMLKRNMYDFVGSDIHRMTMLQKIVEIDSIKLSVLEQLNYLKGKEVL